MLPDEKALVKRLADKPFALIAVNSDVPPSDAPAVELDAEGNLKEPPKPAFEDVRKYVKTEVLDKNGITWRNAIDVGTDGPWASKWNVQGWPTLYVIDASGKIRYKGHDGHAMERMVDELVAEATAPRK
jgi:hypothetical protein